MTPPELTRYLHEHIPLSGAMAVQVQEISSDFIRLSAPLGPNINHQQTVFGGSIAAVATLACWCRALIVLKDVVDSPRIVVASSTINYMKPAEGDFEAICSGGDFTALLDGLRRRGRGRVTLEASVLCHGVVVATLSGVFAALGQP